MLVRGDAWGTLARCLPLLALSATAACSLSTSEDDVGSLEQGSTANAVDCDVRLDRLDTPKLHGIAIEEPTAFPISAKEKIRHLNELNRTSAAFLSVLRGKGVPIKLTGGPVTNFSELQGLRGQVPPGWESTGLTWDDVPGTGYSAGIFLGDSALSNDAWSLAIHEGAHAVDASVGLTATSAFFYGVYTRELEHAPVVDDRVAAYRRSNINEFLAVGLDEYFCSAKTRASLAARYPEVYSYVRYRLDRELRAALAATR